MALRPAISRGEILRKVTHMSVGLFALAVGWLGPVWAAVLGASAVVFNLFLLPRVGGSKLLRDHELTAGSSLGIILYPLAVLILILVFSQKLEIAAATWAILAFGDGMASVAGMTLGRTKLPWNPRKSWVGTIAYAFFGTIAAAALLMWTARWTAPGQYDWPFAFAVCAAAAVLAAALESLPQGLDDNIGVPLVSGLFLLGLVLTQGRWLDFLSQDGILLRLGIALAVNAALAGTAYALRTVNLSGVLAGWLVGSAIYFFLDWRGYMLLLAFFVIGSGCTRFGYKTKAAAKIAQEGGGRRGARHAVANAGVATACALFVALTDHPVLFGLAFAGAFATAAADTSSSEIGQVLGRRTYLPTNFRQVPRGTEGAVSLEGTLAGILASAVIAALGAGVGLYGWGGVFPVVAAAFVGTMFESVVGAALEKRRLLDNEALNFLNTLVGALVAVLFAPWVIV